MPEEHCQEGDTFYEVSRGYRRVAGDSCEGGVSLDLEPYTFECDSNTLGSTGYLIITVLIIAIIALLYLRFSDYILQKWSEFKGLEIFDKAGYFNDLTRAPEGMDEELAERELSQRIDTNNEEEEFNPRS